MDGFDTFRFILHFLYVILLTTGNALAIAVVYVTRQWQTPSGLFIGNLAIIDFLLGSFLLPFGLPALLAGDWVSGRTLCLLNGFTNQLLCVVAVLTLTVISIDRYIAIIHSIRYHQIMTAGRSLGILAGLWTFGIVSAVLPLTGWGGYVYAPGASLCVTDFKASSSFTFVMFAMLVGIPMAAIFFIYIKIFRAVRRQLNSIRQNAIHPESISHNNAATETNTTNKTKKQSFKKFRKESKAALIMFIVIGIFTACMIPYTVFNSYCVHTGYSSDIGDFITSKIAYMNGIFNPLVYGVMNMLYRKGYYRVLYMMFRCRKPPTNLEFSTQNGQSIQ